MAENDERYWVPFMIQEPGCSLVVRGPFMTFEDGMAARESMMRVRAVNEYVGVPFIASCEEEALVRAPYF